MHHFSNVALTGHVSRWIAAAAFAFVAWPSPSRADDVQTVRDPQIAPSPKRPLPDYDGRGREEARSGAGWWALRVPLAPLYLVSELVLRRPLGFLTVSAERIELPRKLYDFFFFGPDHKAGIVPVAFAEFGFHPSVGVVGLWDDAFFVNGNRLRAHFEGWPTEWLAGSIVDRHRIDAHTTVELRAKAIHRPDNVFYGIGPSSLQSSQSRYAVARFETAATVVARFWRGTGLELSMGVRKVGVTHGAYGADPSVEQAAAAGWFPLPYGFNRTYVDPYARVLARLDTRVPGAHTGSGVRVEAQLENGGAAARGPGFVRWGGAATGFLDVTGRGRILSLSAAAAFADPLAPDPIPFTELVALGGESWMPGFFPGRLVDRSSAVAALHYTWPVAAGMNATLQAAVGNVFGEHLQAFHPKLLRFSGAAGVATATDPPLEFLVGFATDTFERGATVDSVRLTVGVPHRF